MKAEEFVEILGRHGVRRFTGVPCSFFQSVYTFLERNAADRYIAAANEGVAMAIAAGTEMAGQRTAVLIQNSGLGNLLNPLTSLHAPYRIPGLLFVSGRAIGIADEPQHELMGRVTEKLLRLIEANVHVMDSDAAAFERQLSAGLREANRAVNAFIVPKGTLASIPSRPSDTGVRSISRLDALRATAAILPRDAVVLSTTGMTSRDWISIDDNARSFYAMGSMGHVMSIALGVAVACPSLCTVALDGDGSLLMHLGALSTIGATAPKRFVHLLIDNGTYESTGNQKTASDTVDFAAVARACGYRYTAEAESEALLASALNTAISGDGPALIRVKVGTDDKAVPARVTDRLTAPRIASRFTEFIRTRNRSD
jgi:phosphonopyruvate decarboxylase